VTKIGSKLAKAYGLPLMKTQFLVWLKPWWWSKHLQRSTCGRLLCTVTFFGVGCGESLPPVDSAEARTTNAATSYEFWTEHKQSYGNCWAYLFAIFGSKLHSNAVEREVHFNPHYFSFWMAFHRLMGPLLDQHDRNPSTVSAQTQAATHIEGASPFYFSPHVSLADDLNAGSVYDAGVEVVVRYGCDRK